MTTSKTARWLDLIAFLLRHHFPVTREEIVEHVSGYRATRRAPHEQEVPATEDESVRRKFERDKDELRALGIEIELVTLPDAAADEAQQGYRLKPSAFYLPEFTVTDDETAAAHGTRVPLTADDVAVIDRATRRLAQRTEFPLAPAAASARRKLAFDLPLTPDHVERVLAAPMPAPARYALKALQQAMATRTAVRCRYHSLTDAARTEHEIEPYGLFFQWSHWYCAARERATDAVRVFRVDRMSDPTALGEVAAFDVPEGFDVRAYMVRAPWELGAGAPVSVRVAFGFPESRWVLNGGMGRPVQPLLDDGGAVVAFEVRDRPGFVRWLLTFRRQAHVLEPPDVAQELERLRAQVAHRYGVRDE